MVADPLHVRSRRTDRPGMQAAGPALDAAIAGLIADVYVCHDGLAERADQLYAAAAALGDRHHADLARLVRAELRNRSGHVDDGVREARAILGGSDDRIVVSHAHAVIAGGLWRIGENAEAVRHAYQAERMLHPADPIALRADHAILLALQINDQRIGGISHEEFESAQRIADASGIAAFTLANLNNWAWCAYLDGDLPRATELVDRLLAAGAAAGEPLNASCADTVARILLEIGRPAEATAVIEEAIRHAASTDSDAVPAALITLADIQRRYGAVETAIGTLETCRRIAARDELRDIDALALRMLADCHAALGEYRSAFELMVDFHRAWTVRRSEKSEVAARAAHIQFAVDEARRNVERLRDMAERDALTGLWNRRRSDAELAAALDARTPTSVALLDLDHFKLINDTYSHSTGDDVLCRVADLLRGVTGHAGRQGGEEFILIIPGDLPAATRTCESLRRALAVHRWQEIAAGLRVTTSIGVTELRHGDDPGSVVRRADRLLYVAKREGRDRVVAG